MPPACGWGNSERNFWFFEGVTAREGVIFPNLRSEVDEVTKKIYPNVKFETHDKSKQDFSKRMVLIVNDSIQNWQSANAVSHMSAYLGRKIDHFDTGNNFTAQDGTDYPRNTQYPIVIKVGTKQQLDELYRKAADSGLKYHGFIKEMIETTNDKKIEEVLKAKNAEEIELYGVGIFGDNTSVDALTKDFELWSGESQ